MAITNSFPTSVSANSIGANQWFADDGSQNSNLYDISDGDITLSDFSNLSIPAGATIDGIQIDVEGAGNPISANIPQMKVYNGSSWSSGIAFVSQFTKAGGTFTPGWGSNTELWGLSWNATTAEAIQIQIDASTMDAGGQGFYWDWLKVKVHYTSLALDPSEFKVLNGKVNIVSGKLTIK